MEKSTILKILKNLIIKNWVNGIGMGFWLLTFEKNIFFYRDLGFFIQLSMITVHLILIYLRKFNKMHLKSKTEK